MSGVDERIVEMKFEGDTFLSGVKNAVSSLLSLKNGLNGLKGSETDINNLNDAGKRFSLSGMSSGLDTVKSKFSLMSVAGIAAIASISTRAVDAGLSLVKSFTIDPIKEGLDSYETKINAIQTILANTASEGTNLQQVTNALEQLNEYSNLTVFNFADMAKNIGTFTAAGVDLKDSVSSIKGIANLAALSGSSAEQASTGMYQLSQAIAAGVVKLQDWNSVVNAGFGGKVFQNALIETARVNGVAVDAMIAKYGSFRQSLQSGWLSAKILTETLSEFTGDLSKSQLEAMGFTAQESEAIMKQAAIAVQSATQIRTISQLTAALKDDVSTAWAGVWEAIIGNSQQAPKVLTAVFNSLSAAILSPIHDLTNLIFEFDNLGGRTAVIELVTNAFHVLGQIFHEVSAAYQTVFPPSGTSGVNALVSAIQNLANHLKLSTSAAADIKTIFEGIFSVFKIVEDVIGAVAAGFSKVGSAAQGSGGGVLSLLAGFAEFIVKVKDAIEQGDVLTKLFTAIGTVLSIPIKALGDITGALGGVTGAASNAVSGITGFISKVGAEFSKLADAIVQGISSGDLTKVGTIINQVLLGGVLVSIRKFISGLGTGGGGGGGLFSSIKESFESLTSALKDMQTSLKTDILLKIAAAVALLTASLVALSFINVGNLGKALAAMTTMFTELLAALSVVSKIAGSAGILKMAVIGVALNELATAILILTAAVAILSLFSWEQLEKGLGAVGVLLLELSVATQIMSKNSIGILASAAAMDAIAVALNIMAGAVALLGHMDFSTLLKGVGTIAALLLVIAGFQKIGGGDQLITSAASMILIGAALNIMAVAIAKLGSLSIGTLVKGIGSVAAVLLILVVAMNAMDTGIAGAAAMIIAAAAITILAKALNGLGSETWGEIGKALVLLAGSLLIIAAAMALMTEAIPGAAALLVVAASLAILTPILIALGALSWDAILKGLAALAGVFVVIGLAGLLLTPIIPSLLALGLAVTLLGAGMLAAGVGVGLFAAGLAALGVAILTAGAAILAFIKNSLGLIPDVLKAVGATVVAFANAIAAAAPALINAFVAIIVAVADGLVKAAPAVGKAITSILQTLLTVIGQNAPKIITTFLNIVVDILTDLGKEAAKFVTAGATLIVNLLNGIASKVSAIVAAAANIVVKFLGAIGDASGQISAAAVKMVVTMINGIASAIKQQTPALQSAMRSLGSAIIQALIAAIEGGLSGVVNAIGSVISSIPNEAKKLLHISSPSKVMMDIGLQTMLGWALGHTQNASLVTDSITTVGQAALKSLSATLSGVNKLVTDSVDLQPRITPVVDLTQAKKGLGDLSTLTKSQLVNAGTSSSTAASISAANAQAATQAGLITGGGAALSFVQNNYSPTSLSAIDIYRQTKNQLSIAKGALASANTG